jgi:hypothetical protein
MKKFFLIMAMMLTMSVYSFAEDSDTIKLANTEKYELKVNHRSLACALDMSKDQMEMSNEIISEFEKDMVFASSMNTEESREKIVANAVKKNIRYMSYILNDKQYRKYLMLLNLTLVNRGFDICKLNRI